jgi:ABC-2 type transport system permease protein
MNRAAALAPSFAHTVLATAASYILQRAAYTIELVRWPAFPVLYFIALYITYGVAGRNTVEGYPTAGFLLVGVITMVLWSSNLWDSGYAIEVERREGTLPALLLSPASRSGVVLGYGLGSVIVLVIPTSLVLSGIVFALGIELQVASVAALVLALGGLVLGSLSVGYALAGLFVLTRRANLLANFFQTPIYLLSGMVVPVDDLPTALQVFSRVFPLSYGMDALRGTLLGGAQVGDIAPAITWLLLSAALLMLLGRWFLKKVEDAAKHGAELDFE